MVERTRREILMDLVAFSGPVERLEDELRGFDWDSDERLVTLTVADVLSVLDRFDRGDVTAEQCAAWADALAGRDDVGFEAAHEDTLKNLVFEICHDPLTQTSAARWRSRFTG